MLDSGAKTRIAPEDLPRHIQTVWTQPLRGDPQSLFRAADQARSILYPADNAGEIFFLLCVKCPVIARHIQAPVGSLVIRQGGPAQRLHP